VDRITFQEYYFKNCFREEKVLGATCNVSGAARPLENERFQEENPCPVV